MKVEVYMTQENHFEVNTWWAHKPEFVVETLRRQLEAAQAIWPELCEYEINKKRAGKAQAGVAGGNARSAALSPERRSEIAKEGAEARWAPKSVVNT